MGCLAACMHCSMHASRACPAAPASIAACAHPLHPKTLQSCASTGPQRPCTACGASTLTSAAQVRGRCRWHACTHAHRTMHAAAGSISLRPTCIAPRIRSARVNASAPAAGRAARCLIHDSSHLPRNTHAPGCSAATTEGACPPAWNESTGIELVAEAASGNVSYSVPNEPGGVLFLACPVDGHCGRGQKLQLAVRCPTGVGGGAGETSAGQSAQQAVLPAAAATTGGGASPSPSPAVAATEASPSPAVTTATEASPTPAVAAEASPSPAATAEASPPPAGGASAGMMASPAP